MMFATLFLIANLAALVFNGSWLFSFWFIVLFYIIETGFWFCLWILMIIFMVVIGRNK